MAQAQRRAAKRDRAWGVAFSLVSHLVILAVAVRVAAPPGAFEPRPMTVELVAPPPVMVPPPPKPAPRPARAKRAAARPPVKAKDRRPPSPPKFARPTPVRARPIQARRAVLNADDTSMALATPDLSAAQLAGAATAGSGAGAGLGGGCDMGRRVQEALLKDALVQSSIARLSGRAILVWDGDWVWMAGDAGKGLTAVRQTMMWEIAFAPEACRSEPMHGLVVLRADASGSVRLGVGSGQWRWSDLLTPRGGGAGLRR